MGFVIHSGWYGFCPVKSQKAQKRLQRFKIGWNRSFARKNAGSSRTARGGLNRFLYRHSTHIQHNDFRPTFSSGTRFSTSGNTLESQSISMSINIINVGTSNLNQCHRSFSRMMWHTTANLSARFQCPGLRRNCRAAKRWQRCRTIQQLRWHRHRWLLGCSGVLGNLWIHTIHGQTLGVEVLNGFFGVIFVGENYECHPKNLSEMDRNGLDSWVMPPWGNLSFGYHWVQSPFMEVS